MADADERSNIRSNFEGDSDKYSRGIASWLAFCGGGGVLAYLIAWIILPDKNTIERQ